MHGCIFKWTQHIGFLALTEMARVVEGNLGMILKAGNKNSVFNAV